MSTEAERLAPMTPPATPRTAAAKRVVTVYPHLWDAMLEVEAEAAPGLREALQDLRDAVEIMDTKVAPYGEREDGTTLNYIIGDSTWHRVLAIARGSTSDKARIAIDRYRTRLPAEPAPLTGWERERADFQARLAEPADAGLLTLDEAPLRVRRCVTHHACECHTWMAEQYRAALAATPVGEANDS